MVATAWVFTLLCASPQAIIFRVLKHPTKEFYQCTTIDFFEDLAEKHFNLETNQTEYILGGINTEAWHTIYHTVVNTQIFFLPLLIIVISYIKIYSILSQWVNYSDLIKNSLTCKFRGLMISRTHQPLINSWFQKKWKYQQLANFAVRWFRSSWRRPNKRGTNVDDV